MKKSKLLTLLTCLSFVVAATPVTAATAVPEPGTTYSVTVSMGDLFAASQSRTTRLGSCSAQFEPGYRQTAFAKFPDVDLRNLIPAGAKVTNVIAYCPKSVRVTQSKFTALEYFKISNGGTEKDIRFYKIDKPTSLYPCNTKELNGTDASAIWKIRVQGYNAAQDTFMDGFTIFGGCQLVIEYTL